MVSQRDIKIQLHINDWLASWNFIGNPFANWEANLEPNLRDYYVKHPFYEQLLYLPKSTIVFAARGGGKTATRLMVQSECLPDKISSSTLAVPFTDFLPLIENYGVRHSYSLLDYIPYLLETGLLYLIKALIPIFKDNYLISNEQLGQLRYWIDKYSPHYLDERFLPILIEKLANTMSRMRVRELVDAFTMGTLNPKIASRYWLSFFALWKQLSQHESIKPTRLIFENTTTAILNSFVDFALTILSTGQNTCDVMYYLFDGIDESALTKNDPKASSNLLKPLLSEMNFHRIQGLANKFFLPLEHKEEMKYTARTDLIETHELNWKPASDEYHFDFLRQMLRDRIRAFSAIHRETLREMCEADVRSWIEDEMLEKACKSPRNLIRLGYLLFFEHCRESPEHRSRITQEDWEFAVKGLHTSEKYIPMLETSSPQEKIDQEEDVPLLKVNFHSMRVYRGDEEIKLSPLEFDLFVYLYQHRGRLCPYDEIMRKLYGYTYEMKYQNEAFRALLKRLRKKISTTNYPEFEYIRVVPRKGLILENTIYSEE